MWYMYINYALDSHSERVQTGHVAYIIVTM